MGQRTKLQEEAWHGRYDYLVIPILICLVTYVCPTMAFVRPFPASKDERPAGCKAGLDPDPPKPAPGPSSPIRRETISSSPGRPTKLCEEGAIRDKLYNVPGPVTDEETSWD